jgi:fused signal recognition particle receptor
MGIFDKFKSALSNTANKIRSLGDFFTKTKIDDAILDDFEDVLITADFGISMTEKIISALRKNSVDKDNMSIAAEDLIKQQILCVLREVEKPFTFIDYDDNNQVIPRVIVMCGVNGNGKTTTIAKLASIFLLKGKRVIVAACDTFRVAAVEQLQEWASRVGCEIVLPANYGSDPASVAYSAIKRAQSEGFDIVIIDTAGRMHNHHNLMTELEKIVSITKKAGVDDAHVLLTIDATTGQNALNQVEKFSKVANVSGLIITKLDGTAKAGIVVSVAEKFKIPIYFTCVGEKVDDIYPFNAEAFTDALLDRSK